ncbi:ubiquinone biosynthesis regulatory protein kinase UbiB [Litorivicinus lipolyticus]|uniref:Probable protein kinase UbiB n=1 Tax=Litorivicinus lipolyticus TaxID=418701 RepID=A0A5Q2Q8W9_9GAMM|nr:ubiquinone biosynthesis regulatory protein kinase UbiB [Litorivicinus lipolyticus]QGG79314.1 ubiquinone biosynthesis regulatory protein kinase UbiB [Litorivicinus lipolyticus]
MTGYLRLVRIVWIVLRFRLQVFLPHAKSGLPRVLLALVPRGSSEGRGRRLRQALEALGPVFVKFGQALSTRRDLLPPDVADELKKLQDQVPPFSGVVAQRIIEDALGQPVEDAFAQFSQQPMASASVAQVHAATLISGEEVVVKVVRPTIERTIRKDLRLMHTLANIIERLSADGRRMRLKEVVRDYEDTILDELDLAREGANTSQLGRNFEGNDDLYVPQVYWDLTRQNVLVTERIYGIPVAEIETLRAAGTDMNKLAVRGVEIFFTQVFRDSFFHADMHPGNIFVDISDPSDPKYIAIDCGIVGSLEKEDQNYLAQNMLAFFRRDYREVARLHVESGWVPKETRIGDLEGAIRSVCEPIFEKPLGEIMFGHLLLKLFQTARRFNMPVQPQLVLLQKTLLNIEGLGRQLSPDLDLWQTGKPILEDWMNERIGPKAWIKTIKTEGPRWLTQLPDVPQQMLDASKQLANLDRGLIEQRAFNRQLHDALIERTRRQRNGLIWIVLGAAVAYTAFALPDFAQHWPWLGAAFAGLGIVSLMRS